MILTTIILCSLFGMLYAAQDRLSTNGEFQLSIFKKIETRWWGPKVFTWINKYKDNTPALGPRFPGAKTWLVVLTDGWHFIKGWKLLCFYLALALNAPLYPHLIIYIDPALLVIHPFWRFSIDVLLYKIIISGTFHIFYQNIFSMKFWQNIQVWMWKMNFFKAIAILLPVFFLLVGGTELLNRLDPRFDPAGDIMYFGDYCLVVGYFGTGFILAWKNFRKKAKEGGQDHV